MTTSREEISGLVQRMLECFNTRQFDDADDLFAAEFVTHPFGTGPEEGRQTWQREPAESELPAGVTSPPVSGVRGLPLTPDDFLR